MENIDRSLGRFMMINRSKSTNHHEYAPIIVPFIPSIPTVPAPSPPLVIQSYSASDFGENAINNHGQGVASHSEKNQVIFNYITRDFRDRCTSYESYKTPALENNFAWDELNSCKLVKADIIYTPYVNAAAWTNTENDNFILTVGSHYGNDGQSDNPVGDDNNRHDITVNSTTFLSHSIAVSARRDTPELFKNSTSEGYGMEFFEDCSPEALDPYYPNKEVPAAFAELVSTDGINITSSVHPLFTQYLTVGEKITIRLTSNETTWQDTYVSEITGPGSIIVSPSIAPIATTSIYGWHDVTIGSYIWGQAESWAVPLVAAKLKVIKMSTDSDWNTVRMAARATAKRNITGIEEIDNADWDIYRGFGCIQVDDAIAYINNNQ